MTQRFTRRRAFSLGLGVAAVAATAVTTGCQNNPSASSEVGFVVGDGSFTMIPVDQRKAIPELVGTDLTGQPLSTSTWAGKVVVLNVWGSWCGPCRKEAPDLVKAAAATGELAQFIGINTRDNSAATALAFERTFGVEYPSFFDPTGELLLKLNDLPPSAIPSTLVLDTQGRAAARVLGATTAATLQGIIDDVAAGK
ncbi:TlpA family protein disulfide reductase [Tessaracoccus sp. SD287]|uniref:TlpA family protein disulfide reductase n=1 Tax=Tessaracoccus sp. SD287 TaxID=2782008 RepID=UPI001A95C158|nr:TlpA disulfide reductase family protein [Tessaracoccus sp. SD287]MBO1031787.1 TlpA family protein disulfide reductase [Tessaracoccus sp. SD287]